MPFDGLRENAVIFVIAALVAVFAVVRLTGSGSGGGAAVPVRIDRSPSTGSAGGHAGATIYVHVAGAVMAPGLLKLPSGSRVATAVQRAGGARPRADLAGINLAAKLEDGQQVLVPLRGTAPGGAGGPGATPGVGSPGAASSGAAVPGAAPPGAAGVPKLSLGSAPLELREQNDGLGPP